MKIDRNIPIGSSKNESKVNKVKEIIALLQPGDSTLIECTSVIQSSYWRAAIDYVLKKTKSDKKFSLKQWDDENYRIWRVK